MLIGLGDHFILANGHINQDDSTLFAVKRLKNHYIKNHDNIYCLQFLQLIVTKDRNILSRRDCYNIQVHVCPQINFVLPEYRKSF